MAGVIYGAKTIYKKENHGGCGLHGKRHNTKTRIMAGVFNRARAQYKTRTITGVLYRAKTQYRIRIMAGVLYMTRAQ